MKESRKWEIDWSDDLLSGNKKIDDYHKKIIEGVKRIYFICSDTKKYEKEIPILTKELENALFEHMDLEDYYLEKFDIPHHEKHKANHKYYKKEIEMYKKYAIPVTIKAVLIAEIVRGYMLSHFYEFDALDIPLINEKIKNTPDAI